jgi:hypothetical protein
MFRANRSGKMIQINPEMVRIPGLNATGEGIDYLERGDHKQCDSILHNGFMGKLRDNGCVENFDMMHYVLTEDIFGYLSCKNE